METAGAVRLLTTTAGNESMLDIARMLEAGMRAEGFQCDIAFDQPPAPARDGLLQLIVAPHEFFPLFLCRHVDAARCERAARLAWMLNVEQPGSQWFEEAWRWTRVSLGAFDISREGAAEFRRRGLEAIHTPLGVTRTDTDPPPASARPIDILFLGHASKRRNDFFATHAEFFGRRHCHLSLSDVARPRRADTAGYVAGAERTALLRDSKIVLNVHAAETTYFESHRALMALSAGCVLATERSEGTAPLVNGTHFLMAPLHDLVPACEALLGQPERLDSIARAGHELAQSSLGMAASCRAIVATAKAGRLAQARSRNEVRSAVRQRLAAALAGRHTGRPEWTNEDNPAYRSTAAPRVSVAITVFNYGRYLRECVESVLSTERVPGGLELVVVDDASTDDSLERARTLVATCPLPIRLVSKPLNTGLADARNIALEEARGTFVLTLDADNWIYPACLPALTNAIESGGHAAVYPILSCFHDTTGEPAGLLSTHAWSAESLVQRPYIDALALFRRDVVLSLGGYSTDLIEHGWFGWEDYDLWLKLADAGHSCAQVPRILAAYRVHEDSMIQRTNQDTRALALHLAGKFRRLADAHPGLDGYFGFPIQGKRLRAAAGPWSQRLEERCENLENELDALHGSWSWRVTSPLRAAYRLLTRRP